MPRRNNNPPNYDWHKAAEKLTKQLAGQWKTRQENPPHTPNRKQSRG